MENQNEPLPQSTKLRKPSTKKSALFYDSSRFQNDVLTKRHVAYKEHCTQFAKRCGISNVSLRQIEFGLAVSLPTIIKVCKASGLDYMSYLI
jgi:transcriptional regulator with XRE-family HTH domain